MITHHQKHLFDLEEEVTYLNCAAYSPLLNSTVEAGKHAVTIKARPYNIGIKDHFFDKADEVRQLFAQLIGSEDKDEIAILPSVSYGLAIVAANIHRWPNIKAKSKILIIAEEFPNNVYAFEQVLDPLNLEVVVISSNNEAVLNAITDDVAAIIVPHVHWISGYVFDLEGISHKCKKHQTMFVIDGTQSVGAFPFDIKEIKPEALICAGYKWLFGPYGQAFGYFSSFFYDGIPIENAWINRQESDDFAGLLRYNKVFRPKNQRYNVGEYSQFIHMPMLLSSLQQILAWKPENIQEYCKSIAKKPLNLLQEMGCNLLPKEERANHLFSISLPSSVDVAKMHNYLTELKIIISKRGNSLRISPHLFNSEEDLLKLVEAIKKIL